MKTTKFTTYSEISLIIYFFNQCLQQFHCIQTGGNICTAEDVDEAGCKLVFNRVGAAMSIEFGGGDFGTTILV